MRVLGIKNKEKNNSKKLKKGVDKAVLKWYTTKAVKNSEQNMREWRNWQTRTFEGRVVHTVRVQVPFLAPRKR